VRSPALQDQASTVGYLERSLQTALTRHTPTKNGSPFPPEVILGGFFIDDPRMSSFLVRLGRLSRSLLP
jgi:hypothetical protein